MTRLRSFLIDLALSAALWFIVFVGAGLLGLLMWLASGEPLPWETGP